MVHMYLMDLFCHQDRAQDSSSGEFDDASMLREGLIREGTVMIMPPTLVSYASGSL